MGHIVKTIISKKKKDEFINKSTTQISKNAKTCYICKKIKINKQKTKNIAKIETIVIIQVKIEVLHVVYVILNIVY